MSVWELLADWFKFVIGYQRLLYFLWSCKATVVVVRRPKELLKVVCLLQVVPHLVHALLNWINSISFVLVLQKQMSLPPSHCRLLLLFLRTNAMLIYRLLSDLFYRRSHGHLDCNPSIPVYFFIKELRFLYILVIEVDSSNLKRQRLYLKLSLWSLIKTPLRLLQICWYLQFNNVFLILSSHFPSIHKLLLVCNWLKLVFP